MSKLSEQPWFERAIRQHADEHGPSGGAWNISMILERLHRAHETGASGAEAETVVSGEAHASMLKAAKVAAAERMRERAAVALERLAYELGSQQCCGHGVPNITNQYEECCGQPDLVLTVEQATKCVRALPTDGE